MDGGSAGPPPTPMLGYVDGMRQLPDGNWIENFIIPIETIDEKIAGFVRNRNAQPGPGGHG